MLANSDGSYRDASVAISDDRIGSFIVTLKKVHMRYTGWYWCAAGQQQVAVHIEVTLRPSTSKFVIIVNLFQLSLFNSTVYFVD